MESRAAACRLFFSRALPLQGLMFTLRCVSGYLSSGPWHIPWSPKHDFWAARAIKKRNFNFWKKACQFFSSFFGRHFISSSRNFFWFFTSAFYFCISGNFIPFWTQFCFTLPTIDLYISLRVQYQVVGQARHDTTLPNILVSLTFFAKLPANTKQNTLDSKHSPKLEEN